LFTTQGAPCVVNKIFLSSEGHLTKTIFIAVFGIFT
jgi:hypothetical protein